MNDQEGWCSHIDDFTASFFFRSWYNNRSTQYITVISGTFAQVSLNQVCWGLGEGGGGLGEVESRNYTIMHTIDNKEF